MSLAQHVSHSTQDDEFRAVSTYPEHNALLASAPELISLMFSEKVSLVKLVVRQEGKALVDINFRYSSQESMQFEHKLPDLALADYYTAEWAVLDESGKLARGKISFSFGINGKPPSFFLDQIEPQQHIMAPDYRLL